MVHKVVCVLAIVGASACREPPRAGAGLIRVAPAIVTSLDSVSGRVVGRAVGDARVFASSIAGPLPVLIHVR